MEKFEILKQICNFSNNLHFQFLIKKHNQK